MTSVVKDTDQPTALKVIKAPNPKANAGRTKGDMNSASNIRASAEREFDIPSEAVTPSTTDSTVVINPTLMLFIAAK